MRHSTSRDTAFNGETTPRHTILYSDSQCLPPGDPKILCAKHEYPVTGKSFIDINIEGGNIATSTGEKYRSLSDTYSFFLLKVSIIILGNVNFRHICQSLTPSETTSLRVLVTRRYVSRK